MMRFSLSLRDCTFTGPSLDSPLNLASTARSSAGTSSAHRTRRGTPAGGNSVRCAIAWKRRFRRRARKLRHCGDSHVM